MSDHVQSIKVFYTNLASNKAHLCWKQSVERAITFWAQAMERVRPQAKVNVITQTLRGIPARGVWYYMILRSIPTP